MLTDFVERIRAIASGSPSEAKLQGELDHILREILGKFNIPYDPAVNEALSSLGLSQVSSTRPDSLFGHVVLDYKVPNLLSSAKELIKARSQVEAYLNNVSGGHDLNAEECAKWAGILWDGYSLTFCHSNGHQWDWSAVHPVSESSLLTLVQVYRSLRKKPFTATLLTQAFGRDSEAVKALLPVMCSHLSKPRHKTTMLFREWKRLFEQVSTYGLNQLPALKEWARKRGIATKDASQILFAIHTFYSLVVKILTSELLAAAHASAARPVSELIANAPPPRNFLKSLKGLRIAIITGIIA